MAYTTPWPICDACHAIPWSLFNPNDVSRPEPYLFWTSFHAFADSAQRGCHTCTLLFESVREPFKTRLSSEAPVAVYLESSLTTEVPGRKIGLTIDSSSLPLEAVWPKALLVIQPPFRHVLIAEVKHVLDGSEVPSVAKNFRDLISQYAEDDGVFRYIKQSLNTCLTKHDKTCNRVIFPQSSRMTRGLNVVNIVHGQNGLVVAPTRLIYVGSDSEPPKLVEGDRCLYEGGHLVLSYCWGSTPPNAPWLLTKARLGPFADAIPLQILPQTLYDAIIWTREIGERYIWIDSMCIVQDDKDDWQREASRMASIYGSATLTLVAGTSNVYAGMSGRRNPLQNSAAALRLPEDASVGTVYILPNGQRGATDALPISEYRSWCYQEDLLSSRIVKLTPKNVQWQCCGEKNTGRDQGLSELRNIPHARWYTNWYQYIEKYSFKSITYASDKLLAWHGIALAKSTSGYYAGLVKSDPWAGLLWCRDETQVRRRPGKRYEIYVAPSWSWAAKDCPVVFYEANGRQWRKEQLDPVTYDPEMHSIDVTAASYFETGAVLGGYIELTANMVIARTGSVEPFLFNTRHGVHTYGRRNLYHPITKAVLGLIVFDIAAEAEDNLLLCCALLHTANVGLWEKNATAGLGLALVVREASAKQVTCRRIGYVQFTAAFSKVCYRRRLRIL